MKVVSITPLKNKETNADFWKVELEGSDKPLWANTTPTFKVGDDIPEASLQLAKSGKSWSLKKGTGAKPYARQGYPKDENAILTQVAFKGAVEAEGYWYVPDGKSHTARIIENTDELVAGLQEIIKKRFPNIIEEAKKLGMVEK